MSDSENELFPVMHKFRQESSIISVRGPQINRTLTNAFRGDNMLSSTLLLPRRFGRNGYDPSMYQNSTYSRRETSPTSLCSVPTMQRPHFNDSYYQRNQYLQRSIRGTSPMSLRSFDSNASISAVDIAMALKSTHFNNNEMRLIKDAFKNLIKSSSRRRIEKRRRKRFRCDKRKSDDSGEQGSSESDDCRSVRTNTHKDLSSSRSTRTDLSYFKHSLKESYIYKDCTDKFRQHTLKNTLSTGPKSIHGDSFRPPQSSIREVHPKGPRSVCSESQLRNRSIPLLKDRFKCSNNFLLPSHRFNRSVAVPTILENPNTSKPQNKNLISTNKKQSKPIVSYQTDSDEDDLNCLTKRKDDRNCDDFFSSPQRKRRIDSDADTPESKKRNENPTPKKISENNRPSPVKAKTNSEFEFAKPMFPVRKPVNRKDKETVISKAPSAFFSNLEKPDPIKEIEHSEINDLNRMETTDEACKNQSLASDMSMRPSFIKRKLFSQKLDVTEAKNGPDSSPDSPQVNTYSDLMKEKTKARKLVANQSCLSRDIAPGNDNFIDLLHKIVPPDRMNITNATNVSNITIRANSNATQLKDTTDPDDKWDVTSILSTCNKSDVSDTFTDEEIFGFSPKMKGKQNKKIMNLASNKTITNNVNKQKTNPNKKDLKVVIERTTFVNDSLAKAVLNPNSKEINTNNAKKPVKTFVDNFFETDYETDSESRKIGYHIICHPTLPNSTRNDIAKAAVTQQLTMPVVKTPVRKKTVSKDLTPIAESAECKKKPGLKNYFQRILKGKNKENVAVQESTKVETTHKIQNAKSNQPPKVNEVKNKHVETIIQIQESIKNARSKQISGKNNSTKKVETVGNECALKKTAHAKPAKVNETVYNNDRSRRVRTPRMQKLTLDVSNNLNATKTSCHTKRNDVTEKKTRGRPRKITATPESNKTIGIDTSLSLNTTMSLRDRSKQAGKDKDNVDKEKTKTVKNKKNKSIENLSPIKVRTKDLNDNAPKSKKSKAESNNNKSKLEEPNNKPKRKASCKISNCKALETSLLNTSMTLRVRKPVQRNTSYVY